MPRAGTVEIFVCDGCGERVEIPLDRGRAMADLPPGWLSVIVQAAPDRDQENAKLFHSAKCALDTKLGAEPAF